MSIKKTAGFFGQNAPKVVYGRVNLSRVNEAPSKEMKRASGDQICAVSDFTQFRDSKNDHTTTLDDFTLDDSLRDIDFGEFHCRETHNMIVKKFTIPESLMPEDTPEGMRVQMWKDDEGTIHTASDTILDAHDVVEKILDDFHDQPLSDNDRCTPEHATHILEESIGEYLDDQHMDADGGMVILYDEYGDNGESVLSTYTVSTPNEYSQGVVTMEDLVDNHIDAYHRTIGDDIPDALCSAVVKSIRKQRMGLRSVR